jgi:hypothetical protein
MTHTRTPIRPLEHRLQGVFGRTKGCSNGIASCYLARNDEIASATTRDSSICSRWDGRSTVASSQ